MIQARAPAFPPPERGRDRERVTSLRAQDDLDLFKGRGLTCVLGIIGAISLALVSSSVLAAGNVTAGRQKALQCQTCHGLDGLSKMPESPNIAGNPEQYLVRQLNAFRKGERKNEMMTVVVQQLSDQDVADLAAYYAAIEVTVKVPK
jgi:cytochrome c553